MSTRPNPKLRCQELLARSVAMAQGESSLAAQALAEFKSRRLRGEDVIMFPLRGKWLVGPAADLRAESDRVGAASRQAGKEERSAARTLDTRKGDRDE